MLVLYITFTIFLFLGMPLAFSIGISSLAFFLFSSNIPLAIPIQKMASSTQSFPMMAIPFFVLAGNLMNDAGITKRLLRFCFILTRHTIGGLSKVTILLSAFMGGISGSAIADVAMQSRLLGKPMIERGYSAGFAAAIISLSGLITATIPPSVGLILYGFVGNVSIGRLFLAGVIPGIIMTIILIIPTNIIAKKRNYDPVKETKSSPKEVLACLWDTKWAILFPIILIMGIRVGIFTPSEAGAFAVVYAFIIGMFVYKDLTLKKIRAVLFQSVVDTGVIIFIIATSAIFGYVIVYNQIPQTIATTLLELTTNSNFLMLVILGILLVAGMFMESTVNVLLLTPIFLPIIKELGVDPVHFGIMMMTLVTLGAMTPPVGIAMFASCSIIGCKTEDYIKESIPFISTIIIFVLFLLYFPSVVMFLPNLVYN